MVECFEDLSEVVHATGFPLYICFASRYYPNITALRCKHIYLDKRPQHDEDISKYVRSKLRIPSDPLLETQLSSYIQIHSSGVFLWVVIVVRMLRKKLDQGAASSELVPAIMAVPTRIQDLLAEILEAPDNRLIATLQWVLFAWQPLQLRQIYAAVQTSTDELGSHIPGRKSSRLAERNFVLDSSRGLVEVTGESIVQFIHESVREYLLDGGLATMLLGVAHNIVASGHLNLAKWCQRYVMDLGAETILSPSAQFTEGGETIYNFRDSSSGEMFPLLRYASKYVFDHLEAAKEGRLTDSLDFLREFPVGLWVKLHNADGVGSTGCITDNSTSLLQLLLSNRAIQTATAVLSRSVPYTHTQCQTTDIGDGVGLALFTYDPNAPCGFPHHSLLAWAISKQLREIINTLLRHGADLNITSTQPRRSHLQLAIMKVDLGTKQQLLDHDANVDDLDVWRSAIATRRGSFLKLLLQYATMTDPPRNDDGAPNSLPPLANNTALAKRLLLYGLDVPVVIKRRNTALVKACTEGNCDMVLFLLHRGVDVGMEDAKNGTALTGAAQAGRADIVQLLLSRGADPHFRSARYGTALSVTSNKECWNILSCPDKAK